MPIPLLLAFTLFCRISPAAPPAPAVAKPAEAASDEPSVPLELPPLVLGQGEQRLLREPGLIRYSVGGPALHIHRLGGSPSGGEAALLLKGAAPGISDLWVWNRDGQSAHRTVHVEKTPPNELSPELQLALGHLEQTEVLLTGAGALLRGEVSGPREAARIRELAARFPKEVRDETEPTPAFLADSEKRIDGWIAATPSARGLKLEREGPRLFVRGSLERPSQRLAAEAALRKIYPQAVLELDTLPDTSPTVYFRVFLLELRKSRFQTLGLAWPPGQEGAFRVSTAGITDALSLDLTLNALEGEGSLKILSNPELVVRAPGEAELFAGGEIPIQSRSRFFSNISWKNYGLSLHLKVLQSSGERVRLEIFTEVSHLDPSTAQDSIPGIQANRMKTEVDARYGTPLLLSGLLQQNLREQAKGLPLLRSIPVLGSLFGSDDYLNERSELVAVLLPASSPPSNPVDRLARLSPRGPAPPPRQWLAPEQERALRQSPEWPWNALR